MREDRIQIRRMKQQDILAVAEIERECFSQPWTENGYRETLEKEYALFLVAETDDKVIVGMCGLINAAGDGDVSNVAVVKNFRKQGIAYRMLQELFKLAADMGVAAFTLEVRSGNKSAIKLYEKCGFESAGVRKNFYENPREDALIMWKRKEN